MTGNPVPHTIEATAEHLGYRIRAVPGGNRVPVRTIVEPPATPGGVLLLDRRFANGGPHLHQIRALVLDDCGDLRAGDCVQFSRTLFATLHVITPHDHVGVIPLSAVYGVHHQKDRSS